MNPTTEHLLAFSTLLALDVDAKALHTRDLQIIALLVAHDTPLAVGQVAMMLEISASHVSRVTDKLVTRGFLTRTEDPADRRLSLLEPSRAGRALDLRVQAHYASARAKSA